MMFDYKLTRPHLVSRPGDALRRLVIIAVLVLALPSRAASSFDPDGATSGGPHIQVQRSATGGAGTSADPWTGWESAFNGIGVDGAEIDFAPGYYKEDVAVTLPVNLMGWLLVNGNGATIRLTAAAPRFLTPNVTADHQTVRLVRIQDFVVDARRARGKNSVIFGDYVNGNALNGWKRVNWDRIVVKRVRAYGLTVDRTTTTHLGGIRLSAIQSGDAEATANTITNIDIEDVRIEGGNWGILIDGNGPGVHTNVSIDNVWLIRCWHSLMARPAAIFPSSNFQVGGRGRVGHVYVIDSYGRYSADSGLELNNVTYGRVTGTKIDDALVGNFYYTNYTIPNGTPDVTWDSCRAAITGSLGSSAYGCGWYLPAGSDGKASGGDFVISNSTYTRSASSVSTFGAAVTMFGAQRSLTLVNDDFSWLNANVDLGSARLVDLAPSDDFRLNVRGARLTLTGTRSRGANGLSLIALKESSVAKNVTIDADGIQGSAALKGTTVDLTIFSTRVAGSAADTITGVVSGSSFDSVSGDPKARGVTIDMTNLDIEGTLRFIAVDGSRLPAGGATVMLDHAPSLARAFEAQMIGLIEPGRPKTPIFSGDGVCTRGSTFSRLMGCFTSADPVGDDAVCR
jgi:hypothetical protein